MNGCFVRIFPENISQMCHICWLRLPLVQLQPIVMSHIKYFFNIGICLRGSVAISSLSCANPQLIFPYIDYFSNVYRCLAVHYISMCNNNLALVNTFTMSWHHQPCWWFKYFYKATNVDVTWSHTAVTRKEPGHSHYNGVIMSAMASQITSLRIIFFNRLIKAKTKENIKALRHWPLWIPRTKGQ